MKHSETKLKTKTTLSNALKELMETKPFNKITVSELTSKCGLNRKTFYYHFRDVRQLLKWTIEQDAVNKVIEYGKINSYRGAIEFAIEYISENKQLLSCAYNAIGHSVVRYFFNNDFRDLVTDAIRHEEDILELKISDKFREFLCSFYTETLTGMIVDIFEKDSEYDTAQLANYLNLTLTTSLPNVIQKAAEEEY